MFDLTALAATIAAHGPVARVVIAAHHGSSPREVGAAMLVWADEGQHGGQSGTIGGGALEWQAIARARALLAEHRSPHLPSEWRGGQAGDCCAAPLRVGEGGEGEGGGGEEIGGEEIGATGRLALHHIALGPALGQCCGGAVTLLTEVYTCAPPGTNIVARSVDGRNMPLAVKRLLSKARGEGALPAPQLLQGWFIEPLARPTRHLWIWGAGHVGRALVDVLAPLPGLAITWVDTAPDRFPPGIPANVRALPVPQPEAAVALAPPDAEHLILTYSHALDLALCHHLLTQGFTSAGLIGSATKWARFRSRLTALGHSSAAIDRITCPIGNPALGKHPHSVAIGVAARLLQPRIAAQQESTG